jgi:hypothetical protein
MTKQCEEKLIADVAETKALLQQFMKEHSSNHKETRGLLPLWAAIILDAAMTLGCTLWRK